MLRKSIIFILLLCPAFLLSAQSESDIKKIHQSHDLFGINSFEEARSLLDEIDSDLNNYWQARIIHLKGLINQEEGNKKEAVRLFKQMEEFIEDTPELNETAEGMALHALAIARQMYLKDVFFALANLKKTIRLTEKSLEFDPNNFTALLVLAQVKTKTPKLFGGDLDFALELLKRAEELEISETAEKFTLYLNLSLTYSRKKSKQLAEFYLEKALEIYPGSSMALRQKEEELD